MMTEPNENSILIRTSIFPVIDQVNLLRELQIIEAKTCLEFGPGASTDILLRYGLKVTTCEHSPEWYEKAKEGLKGRAEVLKYTDTMPVTVEGLPDDATFDCAFVDSPKGANFEGRLLHPGFEGFSRLNTMLFALERAPVVFLHDATRKDEYTTLVYLASKMHEVDIIQGYCFDEMHIPICTGLARVDRYNPDKPKRDSYAPLGKL